MSTQETKQPAGTSAGRAAVPAPAPRTATGTVSGERAGLSSVTGAFRQISPPPRRGPALRRLAALAGWAALLGVVGLGVGVRGLIAILVGGIPKWFEPTIIALGFSGIVLTSGAFLTARRGPWAWLFLLAATGVLVASIVVSLHL